MQKRNQRRNDPSDQQTLKSYLKDISRTPLLTREEERELAVQVNSGEEIALQRLVEANLRFVVKIAKKYRGLGIPFLDLINEGNLGLIEAARRYDPDRGVRFISYAVWWIRQSILLAVSNQARPFRIPLRVNHHLYQLSNLTNNASVIPPAEEIANQLGLTPKKVTSLIPLSQPPVSLNQPLGSHTDFNLLESLASDAPGPERRLIQSSLRERLAKALSQLGSRELQILQLRFGLIDENPLTLHEIGSKIGISRERVRQIQDKALGKLRNIARLRNDFAISVPQA